jgi:hypothetical protein
VGVSLLVPAQQLAIPKLALQRSYAFVLKHYFPTQNVEKMMSRRSST